MKLTFALILLMIVKLSANVYSQNGGIDIQEENVPVETIFQIIREKSDFEFVYNNDDLKTLNPVSLSLKDATPEQILKACLKNTPMQFEIRDKVIILSPREQPIKNNKNEKKTIKGKVIDKKTRQPLSQVNIIIPGTTLGTTTDTNGDYRINEILPEKCRLQFHYVGYQTFETRDIVFGNSPEQSINIELAEEVTELDDVVVTPGRFTISAIGNLNKQFLSRKDLQNIAFGEDIYRAVGRLPGISAGDYSAKFSIRGGETNEVLVLFDGMQLYEPFHMKDFFGGIMSIIDVNAIEKIDIITGGFPAEYGDRLSGVFEMSSVKPSPDYKNLQFGLSMLNARVYSDGTFGKNDAGSWVVSARRGYLDLALDFMDEKNFPSPKYYDFYSKMSYKLNSRQTLSVNLLHSTDKLSFTEDDADVSLTGYKNDYFWIGAQSNFNPKISARTIISIGKITNNREGTGYMDSQGTEKDFVVADERRFLIGSLKQDWLFKLYDFYNLSLGFDLRLSNGKYDYNSTDYFSYIDSLGQMISSQWITDLDGENSNQQASFYVSNRIKLLPSLIAELGMRYDFTSITDEHKFSPRANLVYAFGKKTSIRAGWGIFYQSQNLNELDIQDGGNLFFTSERAENFGLGFEHELAKGINIRIETYHKKLSNLRPSFRNLENIVEMFPELQWDRRIAKLDWAQSDGVEVFCKYDKGGKLSWWSTYALAFANEKIKSLQESTPRPIDQRHTFCFDLNYRPNQKWQFGSVFHYRSGWPYTTKEIKSEPHPTGGTIYYDKYGKYNGDRYPDYLRFDMRINRNFKVASGNLSVFLEFINLFNRKNIRSYEYESGNSPNGVPLLVKNEQYWFPFLPSFGLNWTLKYK